MAKAYLELDLRNCRNIKAIADGPLRIRKNAVNVFYGKNGTGKSTIALALDHLSKNNSIPQERLHTYSYQLSHESSAAPAATCSPAIGQVLIFNDQWVKDHCFVKSSLQSNAYQLYVRNARVGKLEVKRSKKLSSLSGALDAASVLLDTLEKIEKNLGRLTTSGDFYGSSSVMKAFKQEAPLTALPPELKPVADDMPAHDKALWASWHIKSPKPRTPGLCPYCGTLDEERMSVCREYDTSHEDAEVSKWAAIAKLYEELRDCLSTTNAALLRKVLTSTSAPGPDDWKSLASMVATAQTMRKAIINMRDAFTDEKCLDAVALVARLQEGAECLSACEQLFLKTKQGAVTEKQRLLDNIAKGVKAVCASQEALDSLSRELAREVASNINGHEEEINGFLRECGYSYRIKIDCNPHASEAHVLLYSEGTGLGIEQPEQALSYGERNALALILFMFEAVNQKKALVVLDDPISSYDYDKRYGILYALFSKEGPNSCFSKNLNEHTVLVMTHDFLVVSDLINIPGENMQGVHGQFLTCDKDGVLHAQKLDKKVLTPYTQMLHRQVKEAAEKPEIIRLAIIRQLCEQLRKGPREVRTKEAITFDLLSNILHGRDAKAAMERSKLPERSCRKVEICQNYVSKLTGKPFDYWAAVERYADCMPELVELYGEASSSMDKLVLVRQILERDGSLDRSSIMKRFTDETCHLAGSYLYQLDGRVFDQVPFYVVDWCDEIAARAKERYCLATASGPDGHLVAEGTILDECDNVLL